MKIKFVTKDGKPTVGYLTTLERKAVAFMYENKCSACKSSCNTYMLNLINPELGVYGFLRASGLNRGYPDYLTITD